MADYNTEAPEVIELAGIIKDNPGATIMMDNDCWYMVAADAGEDDDSTASGDLPELWAALALIAGIKMEPV